MPALPDLSEDFALGKRGESVSLFVHHLHFTLHDDVHLSADLAFTADKVPRQEDDGFQLQDQVGQQRLVTVLN